MMPGYYMHGYYPPPPPPGVKDFAMYLTRAIKREDVKTARKIFDEAFYKKIELVPDWYHLLCAAASDNAEMVRLLATHGGTWTKEEAAGVKEIYPDGWQMLVWTLGRSGITEDYSDLPQVDSATRLALSRRIFAEDGDTRPLEETDKALSEEILKRLYNGNYNTAAKLLRLRQPEGDIDVDDIVKKIMHMARSGEKGRMAINTLAKAEIHTKPVKLDMTDGCSCPEIIPLLRLYNRLDDEQPQRMQLIHAWARLPAKKHYLGGAATLFGKDMPLSEKEADDFVNLCRNNAYHGEMDPICEDLKNKTGFFTGTAWTEKRLAALNERVGDSALKKAFNEKIADGRFRRLEGKDLLKPETLAAFADAHRKGCYRASYSQTDGLIEEICRRHKNGDVPDNVVAALRDMKEGGAQFFMTAFDPIFYPERKGGIFGRKEPGMVKILLELNVMEPKDIKLRLLHGKGANPLENRGKYAEFFCQLCLEQKYPDEFIRQRGKIASYRDIYIKKNGFVEPPRKAKKFGIF